MNIELNDDFVADIVVQSLKDYHEMMLDHPEEDGICQAIEKVLSHYLHATEYNLWYRTIYGDIDNVE